MKAALLKAPRVFEIVERPLPQFAADEVLVKVAYCGVCTSEVDVWSGRSEMDTFPRFPGHEISGVIEQTGAQVESLRVGNEVGVWIPEGGYAEYVVAKPEDCVRVENVPLEQVLLEPLSCAINAVEQANISFGDDLLIVGAGFMGNLVQKLVHLQGPRQVIVADIRADALAKARQFGATHTINLKNDDIVEAVRELTSGRGVDVSFEVTGVQAPLLFLGDVTRMSGKIVLVGYHQGGTRTLPLGQWNYMAFQLVNAHFRDLAHIRAGMQKAMRLLTSHQLSLDELITHYYELDAIQEAFTASHEKPENFVKAVIRM